MLGSEVGKVDGREDGSLVGTWKGADVEVEEGDVEGSAEGAKGCTVRVVVG